MRVKFWGVRGSVPVADTRMARYGGNTSCVEVVLSDGTELILDAGTGIRGLGMARAGTAGSTDILLTHLHLDHIQGLMFFNPFFDAERPSVVWGPWSIDGSLRRQLGRYISAPLSPIEITELPGRVSFESCPATDWEIGGARVTAALVNHRGPTFGYRITEGDTSLCYIPDHEPALGESLERADPDWISGFNLARGASLLIHDGQYTDAEYPEHLGWGHSGMTDALLFARRTGARRVALFHHDPLHDDEALDGLHADARERWSDLDGDPDALEMAVEQATIVLESG
jgi:phosphoribosyl 1,2-cyclic phosphodiesterase